MELGQLALRGFQVRFSVAPAHPTQGGLICSLVPINTPHHGSHW